MTQGTRPQNKAIAAIFDTASNTTTARSTSNAAASPHALKTLGKQSVGFDTEYYQSFLDDYDIPEDQKRELIEALWAIIAQLIDLGFGVHPINSVQDERQTDETLSALKAIAQDFATENFEHDMSIDPVLMEELIIADQASAGSIVTQKDTQTERSET